MPRPPKKPTTQAKPKTQSADKAKLAKPKPSAAPPSESESSVTDYRHTSKRKNIPTAGLAAQGKVKEVPKTRYSYDPHLPPVLRFDATGAADLHSNPRLRLQSRYQLFPQVLRYVCAYVERKVDWRGVHPCELGLEKYFRQVVERLLSAIRPNDDQGEPPLMPILNRYKPIRSTAEVDFKTTRPCFSTVFHSHLNLVAADTQRWEQAAAFRLEQAVTRGLVKFYARNDQLGFSLPYVYMNINHHYEPDYLVRLASDVTLVLEIKGAETEQDRTKHQAAQRWQMAVNNWGQLGQWAFHVNKDPQVLVPELEWILGQGTAR